MHGEKRLAGKIAIVGGGISGLALAYYLARAEKKVTLYEASSEFGGLGSQFEFNGNYFEKFYHCMLPTDDSLLKLLSELKLEREVYWKESQFGYYHQGQIYPLNTASDLLKFKPLSFLGRLRLGASGIYTTLHSGKNLDRITFREWIIPVCGNETYQKFFRPLLAAKFGGAADGVPALWFWARFNREKGAKKEVKGYIRGGYRRIVAALSQACKARGATLLSDQPVSGVSAADNGALEVIVPEGSFIFDAVVATCPLPLLFDIVRDDKVAGGLEKYRSIDYAGVINTVIFLKEPLKLGYWTATPEEQLPFQGIVNLSALIDIDDLAGEYPVHLMYYCHRNSEQYRRNTESTRDEFSDAFVRHFLAGQSSKIKESFCFKAPFVEPLFSTGFLEQKPVFELLPGHFYLCTTPQVYPEVASWNSSIQLARELSRVIERA
ncbi:MAG: FAD-dependent oxidoreductase [Candidatus Dadabacteria bacterium]|nr:MAG: FAD-dependent oxidoreductase [Candidatus Dadabacteria bacterium]